MFLTRNKSQYLFAALVLFFLDILYNPSEQYDLAIIFEPKVLLIHAVFVVAKANYH